MKKIILLSFLLTIVMNGMAQKRWYANYDRYSKSNARLEAPKKGENRVVFMGNSITDGWPGNDPEFFKDGIIGRGISGQTSDQFLLRFRQDVIALKPKVVVINYGTNDIAENNGSYNEDYTFSNIQSMVELAKAHKIKVVLASCLPAKEMPWRKEVKDVMAKIRHLNARVEAYAKANKVTYVDYFSHLVSEDGTCFRPEWTKDGVHPNRDGYKVMEQVIAPVIAKLRK